MAIPPKNVEDITTDSLGWVTQRIFRGLRKFIIAFYSLKSKIPFRKTDLYKMNIKYITTMNVNSNNIHDMTY